MNRKNFFIYSCFFFFLFCYKTKASIIFNEILPNPKGPDKENEWIELKNDSDKTIDISNWSISDLSKRIFKIPKEKKLLPKEIIIFKSKETKIILNNDKETLFLKDDKDNLIDTLSYYNAPENKSFCKIENQWQWCSILTPGKENQFQSQEAKNNLKAEIKNNLQSSDRIKNSEIFYLDNPKIIFLIAFLIALFSAIIVFFLNNYFERN
jgi:hypothetical protein